MRAITDDYIIIIRNIGDVSGPIIKTKALLRWNRILAIGWTGKIDDTNESISGRSDVIIGVRPWVNSDAVVKSRFRWKWCPAYVIVVVCVPP